ncbi:condensation domain-containing protein [Chromobacterium haemolyticum]|nr:condensation domain-containing protein [Chromobacterium haemolyticum]
MQRRQLELQSLSHSDLAEVQRHSGVPRGQPLFETLVAIDNFPIGEALPSDGLGFRISDVSQRERTHYPLTLTLVPGADGLSLKLGFDRARVDDAPAAALAEAYLELLRQIAARPDAALRELGLVRPSPAPSRPCRARAAGRTPWPPPSWPPPNAFRTASPSATAPRRAELPATARPGRRHCGTAASRRRAARRQGRHLPAALRRTNRRHAGGDAGRRRLSAAGSGLSGGAAGLPTGRQPSAAHADRRRTQAPAAGGTPLPVAGGDRLRRQAGGAAAPAAWKPGTALT